MPIEFEIVDYDEPPDPVEALVPAFYDMPVDKALRVKLALGSPLLNELLNRLRSIGGAGVNSNFDSIRHTYDGQYCLIWKSRKRLEDK